MMMSPMAGFSSRMLDCRFGLLDSRYPCYVAALLEHTTAYILVFYERFLFSEQQDERLQKIVSAAFAHV
jgi:hypothetical protein